MTLQTCRKESTYLVVESSFNDLTVCSSRVLLHIGMDLPETNAFNSGIKNFNACLPFVSHIALLRCTKGSN